MYRHYNVFKTDSEFTAMYRYLKGHSTVDINLRFALYVLCKIPFHLPCTRCVDTWRTYVQCMLILQAKSKELELLCSLKNVEFDPIEQEQSVGKLM